MKSLATALAASVGAAAVVGAAAAGVTSIASSSVVAAPQMQLVVSGAPMPLDPAADLPTPDQLYAVLNGLANPGVPFRSKGNLVEGGAVGGGGRGHAGFGHDVLGELLRALDLGGRGGGAETGNAGCAHRVCHARHQRRLRAHHDERRAEVAGEGDDRGTRGDVDRVVGGDRGRAGVAGGAVEGDHGGIAGQRKRQGVLAAAVADDEDGAFGHERQPIQPATHP